MSDTTSIATEQLVSLVYVSSAISELEASEITALLMQARKNNSRSGLTGMLLYRGGNFLQVLEGPVTAVESTLERIKQDPRHHGIMVMKKTPIQTRRFSEWTMAFRRVESEELRLIEGYSPFMELSFDSEVFRAEPDFAVRMLLQFKDKMR